MTDQLLASTDKMLAGLTDVAGSANATETDLNKGAEGSLPEQTVTVDQIATTATPEPTAAPTDAPAQDVDDTAETPAPTEAPTQAPDLSLIHIYPADERHDADRPDRHRHDRCPAGSRRDAVYEEKEELI